MPLRKHLPGMTDGILALQEPHNTACFTVKIATKYRRCLAHDTYVRQNSILSARFTVLRF